MEGYGFVTEIDGVAVYRSNDDPTNEVMVEVTDEIDKKTKKHKEKVTKLKQKIKLLKAGK